MKRKDMLVGSVAAASIVLNVFLAFALHHARSQQDVKASEAAALLLEGQQGEWEYILKEVKSRDPEHLDRLEKWLERGIRSIGSLHKAVQTAGEGNGSS